MSPIHITPKPIRNETMTAYLGSLPPALKIPSEEIEDIGKDAVFGHALQSAGRGHKHAERR
jgi:hypothetical protein